MSDCHITGCEDYANYTWQNRKYCKTHYRDILETRHTYHKVKESAHNKKVKDYAQELRILNQDLEGEQDDE